MAPNPFDTNPKRATAAAKSGPGLEVANGDNSSSPRALSPFAIAGDGGENGYRFTDFKGELLLVQPLEVDVMPTKISAETEVVRVNVVRLDHDNEQVDDLLVFQSALIRNLKKVLRGPNTWVLGRLTMGEERNGKSAPYLLSKPTDTEVERAQGVISELNLV